jgi:wyosine [tRNA(Phe)-imidazoG37] synthetase (radical SAM superfamily)
MTTSGFRYVYGPVPSQRLGLSLGVDLVPFKTCTYDCIYCQLGRTSHKTATRQEYVPIADVICELEKKLAEGPAPDYVTLSGSGEPTLNARIGQLLGKIKKLTSIPVAVLTNGSLLWRPEVQDALMEADLVLPSLDAGDDFLFQYVNRPHEEIAFDRMVQGLAEFTGRFAKPVWLEIFLLAGVTGLTPEVEKIAALARRIKPERVQLHTVSRPPAEEYACPVSWMKMQEFAALFAGKVEVISSGEYEKSRSEVWNEATDADILALLSRRPCTIQGISTGLGLQAGEVAERLAALAALEAVMPVQRNGAIFYKLMRGQEKKCSCLH